MNKSSEVRRRNASYLRKALPREFAIDGSRNEMVSVITPIYGEEDSIDPLFGSLLPVLRGLGRDFEIIAVNDGSRDASLRRFAPLAPPFLN
jgi:cellulose synthase/poly-beta-1,6-N-acetylglucosamine synthase-like glycosyltransferase